jgi:hypothetical protein
MARHAGDGLAERPKRHAGAALVDVFLVTKVARNPALLPAGHLSAVLLGLPFGQQNPVGQVGKLGKRGFAALDGLGDQVQAPPLERRVAVGVLGKQPGGVRAVLVMPISSLAVAPVCRRSSGSGHPEPELVAALVL